MFEGYHDLPYWSEKPREIISTLYVEVDGVDQPLSEFIEDGCERQAYQRDTTRYPCGMKLSLEEEGTMYRLGEANVAYRYELGAEADWPASVIDADTLIERGHRYTDAAADVLSSVRGWAIYFPTSACEKGLLLNPGFFEQEDVRLHRVTSVFGRTVRDKDVTLG